MVTVIRDAGLDILYLRFTVNRAVQIVLWNTGLYANEV